MANPTLNENTFNNDVVYVDQINAMTVNGTIKKTLMLLLFVVISGAFTWKTFVDGNMGLTTLLMMAGVIAGFILALIISFKQKTAPILAPFYAVCEGLALGGISASFEAQYPGIVFQAIAGSLVAMFSMLALYLGKVIEVTNKFRSVILIATLSIAVLYLVNLVLAFFGISIPFIYNAGPIGIGFSVLVVLLAAFNLLLDFDIIERGVQAAAPKYFEWYCSFGLLVTLVWLYMEILRLLSKLNRK